MSAFITLTSHIIQQYYFDILTGFTISKHQGSTDLLIITRRRSILYRAPLLIAAPKDNMPSDQ
ncbi:MAG: hypothetical protein IMF17_04115 [Proteobacteria bacterium]|nr:hypothetical protein [Pseudomonadota bacterium]